MSALTPITNKPTTRHDRQKGPFSDLRAAAKNGLYKLP
jgi:hypothetical protein